MPGEAVSAWAVAKEVKESLSSVERFLKWLKGKRYPKSPKGKLGIAVAIYTDNSLHREQITLDFIQTLENLANETDSPFAIVDVPPHLAVQIKTLDDRRRVLERTRCIYLISGKARFRNVDKQPTYVLDLNSYVTHATIPIEVSKRLSKEISELIPSRGLIPREEELFGFEVTATLLHLAVQYIIATAALVSGEFVLSRNLFQSLRPKLNSVRGPLPVFIKQSIKVMKVRTPHNITVTHIAEARVLYARWRKDRKSEHLPLIKAHLDRAENHSPMFYDIWLMKALYWFVAERNIVKAKQELMKCSGINDSTWRFSEAFLLAYSGKLTEALRIYRAIMKSEPSPSSSLLVEVEEFITWIVQEEPEKVQLHFCLGVINYFGKEDHKQAEVDFDAFLNTCGNGHFERERVLAEKYLAKLRS